MKLTGLCCLALLLATKIAAAPIAVSSHITSVTVYLDRAVVTRTASFEVPAPGPLELTFEKLPANLSDDSLQVSGSGTAAATLLDATPRSQFVDFTPNDRVKALEDELRALQRQDRTLADRVTILGQQRDYVLKIQTASATPPKEAPAAPTSPDAWLPLLKFSEDQLAKIAADLQSTELQREDLAAKRAALEQQLNELRGNGSRSFKTVALRLAAASPGRLELTLRYTVPDASWAPHYDIRADSAQRKVQIGYSALVSQNTGEDWTAVDLTLSTARPSLGGAAPELSPWIVQMREMRPLMRPAPSATSIAPTGAGGVVEDEAQLKMLKLEALAAQARRRELARADTTVEAQATSATFHVAGATDLPSDNAPHKVGVTSLTLAADLAYQSTPKLQPAAYLSAKVKNTSDFPLLPGAASVFLDGTFVASSNLAAVMPGEPFDLALGADDALAVKRKLTSRFTEDTGVVNRGRRVTYDILFTVQNNKPTPATLALRDQIPVSRHEKIIIKLLAPDDRDLKPDADGFLKWNLALKPGEKRELPLKFSIEYPNDLPVIGLE